MLKRNHTLRICVPVIKSVGIICCWLFTALVVTAQTAYVEPPTSLAGSWQFAPDYTDAGISLQWFMRPMPAYRMQLPGIVQAQNFGYPISASTPWVLSLYDRYWYLRDEYKQYATRNVKVPFLSQPPRHFLGVTWFQREINVTPYWATRRVVLTLERPHWETTVWVDGNKIGSDKSLVAPHVYDLGSLTQGRHRLTIRVDNRMIMPYRPDAHSVSDSLGSSWNGIVGRIDLTSTGRVWIDDAQAFPNLTQRTLLVKVRIGNVTGRSGTGTLTAIWPDVGIVPVSWDEEGGTAEVEVPLRPDVESWDEFHPKLYTLKLWLKGPNFDEYKELSIGMRDFHAQGKDFILNGRPINFRGTHHGGDFPLTGYPPTDVNYWTKLFETCRAWGLNHMRFHSWCPPEAAFEAADKLGFYLQPEPGMWNEISPGTPMDKMLYEETDRMIKAYGNHPSFMLLSASNEPKGKWRESLSKWVDHYHKQDPRRLYANGTGHTEREFADPNEGTDYLAVQRIGPKMLRRESGWFGADFADSLTDIKVPVISHEVGQWVAYPDFEIIKSFKGYLQPGNFEIFRDSLEKHGLLEKNWKFAYASGRFQLACYKEEIEANLRTPGLGGFQLLDLHDYLGQGTALVGLLDAFWQPKSYVKPGEFTDFCNTTVPLARLRKRLFTTAETLDVDVELAHFGAEPLENHKAVWRIEGGGREWQGEWEVRPIPIGKNFPLGKISLDLSKLQAPGQYRLIVTVGPSQIFGSADRKVLPGKQSLRGTGYFENEWDFWLYPQFPEPLPPSPDCPPSNAPEVLVTRSWEEAEKRLMAGGRVLFVPRNSDLDWTSPPLDTVPVFWNRLMGPAWGRMLGLWIDRKDTELKSHTLDGFVTGATFDRQWAELVQNVRAVNLDQLPPELEPVVWAIDDWNRNYKLGVIFECSVGDGRLLVSAIDVTNPNGSNPVTQQLRAALLRYAAGDCFQPKVPVTREQLRSLLFDTVIMKRLGATAEVNGLSDSSAIDGDPNTYWLAGDRNAVLREQISMVVHFPAPVKMAGVVLMPRQNHREHEGDIRDYVIQISDDGKEWRDAASGQLGSSFEPREIRFADPLTARHLRLISLSGFGADKTTSLAELAVIYVGPKLPGSDGGTLEYKRSRTATPEIDEGNGPGEKPKKPASPQNPRPKN